MNAIATEMPKLTRHAVVTEEAWLAARRDLLRQEKQMSRLRDEIAQARRALPWVKVNKTYTFDTPEGKKTLAALFAGRSQLVVQHFMFKPEWDEGCSGCSFMADAVDGTLLHLNHHDVSFTAVSRAPLEKLLAYRKRMGWHFPWVSSSGCDFNYDYRVSFTPEQVAARQVDYNYVASSSMNTEELPGLSVFYRDAQGQVFHTYSTYGRGTEEVMLTYRFLDLTPKGRTEHKNGNMNDWMRRHDKYEAEAAAPACCGSQHK